MPDRKVRFLAGVALFGLLMSFGGHAFLYNWIERVFPWLKLMRFPVKFVVLTTFCLPLMSAFGLSWLLSLSAQARAKEWRNVALLGGGFICLIAFIVWFSSQHPVAGVASGVVLSNAALRAVFLALAASSIRAQSPKLVIRNARIMTMTGGLDTPQACPVIRCLIGSDRTQMRRVQGDEFRP